MSAISGAGLSSLQNQPTLWTSISDKVSLSVRDFHDWISNLLSTHPSPQERIQANIHTWQELQT